MRFEATLKKTQTWLSYLEILTTLTTLVVIAIAIKFLMRVMWQTVQRYISVLSKEGAGWYKGTAGWSNVETTQNQTENHTISFSFSLIQSSLQRNYPASSKSKRRIF